MDGQGTTRRRNIAENFNRLSRVHQRYRRQTTDGRATTYSEREREFTFDNKMESFVYIYITKNAHRISHRFQVIARYWSNFRFRVGTSL